MSVRVLEVVFVEYGVERFGGLAPCLCLYCCNFYMREVSGRVVLGSSHEKYMEGDRARRASGLEGGVRVRLSFGDLACGSAGNGMVCVSVVGGSLSAMASRR